MKREKTGQKFTIDTMPGYAKMAVGPIRGADALDWANLEKMDEDPKAASLSLHRLVDVQEWGWYYDLIMKDEDGKPKWDWNKVLTEDLNLILAGIQCATYGPILTLDMVCQRKCHPILGRWRERIPLHSLEVTQYDSEILKDFHDHNRTRRIPEEVLGYDVEYSLEAHPDRKVEVGKGASKMEKYAAAMTSSVLKVTFEDGEEVTEPADIRDWVLDLNAGDLEDVVNHIQDISMSAGVQKTWKCACPNPECQEVHVLPLPFVLSPTSPSYRERGLNRPYTRGLRKFRGSSLFPSLVSLDSSCKTFAQQGKATTLD
jgi:hypothetical protein